MPETEQELGREGVKRVRRLLDGTMRFNVPYDVYANPERVILPLLPDGETKHFDALGHCLTEDGISGADLYIESKNFKDAGNQASEFKEFLAHAYSGTKRMAAMLGTDPKLEFMWATTCPWKGKGFREITSEAEIRDAIQSAGDHIIPADHAIDEETLRLVSRRLWVWVISDRQEEMIMGGQLRGWVAQKIEEAK